MTRFVFIVSLMLGFSLPVCAQLFRVPAASIKLAKTGAEMTSFPRLMPELTKRIFAASRSRFAGPRELMARVPKGLIQVARPESPTVLGTGFYLNHTDNYGRRCRIILGEPRGKNA